MGRSPVLGVTRDEVSGEREQTGREGYPQAAGQLRNPLASAHLRMATSESF